MNIELKFFRKNTGKILKLNHNFPKAELINNPAEYNCYEAYQYCNKGISFSAHTRPCATVLCKYCANAML